MENISGVNRIQKAVVFSHRRDIDGIASASIIVRFEQVSKIYLLDYGLEYFKAVEKILSKLEPCKIFISDLGLPNSLLSVVSPVLRMALERGFKILWFDHHIWPKESLSMVERMGIDLEMQIGVSAAEIVSQYYGGDLIADMLASLAHEGDYPPVKRKVAWLLSHLINYYHYADIHIESPALLHLISKLSKGILWDAEMQACMDKQTPIIRKAYDEALKNHFKVRVSGYVFTISRFDTCIPPVLGAWRLLKHSDSDLAIGYYDNGEIISIRDRDVNVDCNRLAMRFNGGGHTHLAGGRLPPGVDNPGNWIVKKLKSEPIPILND